MLQQERVCLLQTHSLFFYTPIQEEIPKVVAIAVKPVMTMLMIFPQTDLFSIGIWSYNLT